MDPDVGRPGLRSCPVSAVSAVNVNLPNLITLTRLLMVPAAVWLIVDEHLLGAFWVFVAAGVSDAVDGFIAKQFDAETELGRYLDPLADKALLVSVYVTLGHTGHLASWLVILVVFRDVLIVGGAILYQTLTQSLDPAPLLVSKINTAAQIVLAAAVLGKPGLDIDMGMERFIEAMVWVVAATTFVSGAAYLIKWGRRAAAMERGE